MTLPIAYFPPISWFLHLLHDNTEIEAHENYVKQTLRNRCQIATACGVQNLSVPIVRNFSNDQRIEISNPRLITNIQISPHDNWYTKHWHTIETAYGESAFFDYYADDLKPFFEKVPQLSLFDHNISIIRKLLELMEIDHELSFTEAFEIPESQAIGSSSSQHLDSPGSQHLDSPDSRHLDLPPYYQVFREKHGFLPDLSILDLLFNLGPESACYLLAR